MIHLPILRHARRLTASVVLFGSAVMLMLWLPIQILKTLWPTFLPYTLSGDSEVNELSLQLLLLQVSPAGISTFIIIIIQSNPFLRIRLYCPDSLNSLTLECG